jgi:hypothetical protein
MPPPGADPQSALQLPDIFAGRDSHHGVLTFGTPVNVSAAPVDEDSGGTRRADRRTNLVAPINTASAATDSHANTSPTMA